MTRINKNILLNLSSAEKERNIYTHPLFLARDIFWQRLDFAFLYIQKYLDSNSTVIDFGGGSGVFSKSLCNYFNDVSIIDLDTEEAENIKEYFSLSNLKIYNQDINNFKTDIKYDTIIATDVLEHFQNLEEPLNFFRKYLKEEGKLLVTLPTENFLYELGRKVINKTKPLDHYHKSKEVIDFLLKNNFEIIDKTYAPKYLFKIPLFEVVLLRYMKENNGL